MSTMFKLQDLSQKSRILILKYRKGELNTENEKLVIEFVKQYCHHKQTKT
jgi:hypothetical protein